MPVTPPPSRKAQPTEADIEKAILKGGQPPKQDMTTADASNVRHINVRLTEEVIEEIDGFRAKRPRRLGSPKMGISLRDWIVEAIQEKLERDRQSE